MELRGSTPAILSRSSESQAAFKKRHGNSQYLTYTLDSKTFQGEEISKADVRGFIYVMPKDYDPSLIVKFDQNSKNWRETGVFVKETTSLPEQGAAGIDDFEKRHRIVPPVSTIIPRLEEAPHLQELSTAWAD